MKTLIVLSVVLVLTQATLVNYLKEVQNHESFKKLSTDQKLIFSELVIAAETNTLQAFIDRVGLINVLDLMDNLDHPDAQKLSAYLAEHLGYHNHSPSNGGILHKRDNDDSSDDEHHHAHAHMTHTERKLYENFRTAAKTGMLNEYLDNVGLGALFGVLEKLGAQQASEFLTQAKQTLSNPIQKRDDVAADATNTDDGDDDDGDDDDGVDDGAAAKAVVSQVQKSDVAEDDASSESNDSDDSDDSSSDESNDSDDDDDAAAKTVVNKVEKRDDDSDEDSDEDSDDDDSKAKLSHADKQNYKQLKAGVSLQSFLDTSSLGELFGLMEKLDASQYEDLINQLQKELANQVQKRDHGSGESDDDDDNSSKAFKLTSAEKKNYKQIKTVSVQNFLETSSLGELFGLLEKLDAHQYQDLVNQLQKSLTLRKRDDGSDDSDDDDSDDDDDDDSAQRNHLSKADQRTSEHLTKAIDGAKLGNFLEKVGLGSVFGLLEKLDKEHAATLRTRLEAELQKEAL